MLTLVFSLNFMFNMSNIMRQTMQKPQVSNMFQQKVFVPKFEKVCTYGGIPLRKLPFKVCTFSFKYFYTIRSFLLLSLYSFLAAFSICSAYYFSRTLVFSHTESLFYRKFSTTEMFMRSRFIGLATLNYIHRHRHMWENIWKYSDTV